MVVCVCVSDVWQEVSVLSGRLLEMCSTFLSGTLLSRCVSGVKEQP